MPIYEHKARKAKKLRKKKVRKFLTLTFDIVLYIGHSCLFDVCVS